MLFFVASGAIVTASKKNSVESNEFIVLHRFYLEFTI